MKTPLELYEKHVIKNETGCWDWSGCKMKGYGVFSFQGKVLRAHRVSYELHIGPFSKEMLVLHNCDNPSCSNPLHLYLGTQQDNVKDRVSRNRSVYLRGDDAPWSKLTSGSVTQIKELLKHATWGMQKHIAKQFNIHESTLCDIKHGRTWGVSI